MNLVILQSYSTTFKTLSENRARPDFLRIKKTKNTSRVIINARRALRLIPVPDSHRVDFEIWTPGTNDSIQEGTMSGAKSRCPVCGIKLTPEYLKECGQTGKLGTRITSVVVDTTYGKEYRLPKPEEEACALEATEKLRQVAAEIPYALPLELQQKNPRTLIVQLYGLTKWNDLFLPRQLLMILTYIKWLRRAREEMKSRGYPLDWSEAVTGYLAAIVDKCADYGSSLARWENGGEFIVPTYQRFALPMIWDFVEINPTVPVSGSFANHLQWILLYIKHACEAVHSSNPPNIIHGSATDPINTSVDLIVTDPPYYSAIPYADLSDFFYVFLRRSIGDQYPHIFETTSTSKDQELALRLPHADLPDEHTPAWYEQGMGQAFQRAWETLTSEGRMVIVFAHKEPEAWETLVSAMVKSGFTVSASWPIDTEREVRPRAHGSAALASSIWLVCRKRSKESGIGRYVTVKKTMQERVTERLRYFWDMGISGPDFVWAAVGPALESYSAYEEVRRMDGSIFNVGEFLREVRRMVADFALGQILKGQSTEGLDEWSRYYLIHRNLFGVEEAPVGECILLSQGYGIDLNDLKSPRGILVKASKKASGEDDEESAKGSSSGIRLAKWDERKREDLGQPHPSGGLPMIDMIHRLMWLWASGDTAQFRAYADEFGLGQNELFWAMAQAILEMAEPKSRERTLLEAVVAWGRGSKTKDEMPKQETFDELSPKDK